MPRPRVLIAKLGLDGHDRGARVVARALRDAGMEVVYLGLWQTPAAVADAARDEDVDVIGVSLLSGAHRVLLPKLLRALKRRGLARRVPVVVGGIIPDADARDLKRAGIAALFQPGTSLRRIAETVRRLAASGKRESAYNP